MRMVGTIVLLQIGNIYIDRRRGYAKKDNKTGTYGAGNSGV